LKPIKTPRSEGYHPDIDDTPMCNEEYSAKYRSMIRCCIWIILFGMFDIAHATSAMSGFKMSPKEGHQKATKRILAYLKIFQKERMIVDKTYPNHTTYPIEDHPNWKDFFPFDEEEILKELPKTDIPYDMNKKLILNYINYNWRLFTT
jgi:hypothetical protein